ncbi:MAG: SET domain-containing protein [Candidatus Sungbacteria bacterium]|uniref:SET domain-containing protein n=1 Tax=Candidatus Sungiibacteriota bacterium TaxID=2750080 RepID=A0A932VR55_9BACT|nr:SET domain-containing protein [Candidatus Sungbacteria bacterium]
MTQKDFLADLEKNIYCRLQPSGLHGIGIFAIRDIPKGTDPFPGCRAPKWRPVRLEKLLGDEHIVEAVKKFAQDIFSVRDGIMYVPDHSLNAIDISYFLNHGDRPNIAPRAGGAHFVAIRDIKTGEELVADYRTYTDR